MDEMLCEPEIDNVTLDSTINLLVKADLARKEALETPVTIFCHEQDVARLSAVAALCAAKGLRPLIVESSAFLPDSVQPGTAIIMDPLATEHDPNS